MTWDSSVPTGTRAIKLGDDDIRELKTDVQAALRGQTTEGTEAVFPGSSSASPVYRPRFPIGTTAARPAASADRGIYVNTTINTIQRCDSSSWVDIATLIPSGTKMVFFQASAPVGWTLDTSQNDKALRIVSGTGGGTGGSTAFSSAWAAKSSDNESSHTHSTTGVACTEDSVATGTTSSGSTAPNTSGKWLTGIGGTDVGTFNYRVASAVPGTATSGAGSAHSHNITAYDPQYIDVIVCTKD